MVSGISAHNFSSVYNMIGQHGEITWPTKGDFLVVTRKQKQTNKCNFWLQMPSNVQLSFQFLTEFFSLMISQSLWSNNVVRVPLQSTTLRIKQSEYVTWGDASDAKSNPSKDIIILHLIFIISVLSSQNMLMAIIYDLMMWEWCFIDKETA